MANDLNPADFLDRPEQVANYLTSYLKPHATLLFPTRLGCFIVKHGPKLIAEHCNMRVETVYNMLQPQTKIPIDVLVRIMDAMGYQLTVTPKE